MSNTGFSRRAPLRLGLVALAGLGIAGCSPTYGTDKTANEQLMEDLTGIMSLGPRDRKVITYKPRPELVKPESLSVLPPPQADMASSENPQWPESPEQRLARIRAENSEGGVPTTAIIRDGNGREQIVGDPIASDDPRAQREEFKRRLAESRAAGDPAVRRNLSEPPVEYRQPASTAPVGEIGEDEWKKERDAKRAAGQKRRWLPW